MAKNRFFLIFSARIAEQRVETVEFSLEQMKVVQCHGLQNKDTEHHAEQRVETVEFSLEQMKVVQYTILTNLVTRS